MASLTHPTKPGSNVTSWRACPAVPGSESPLLCSPPSYLHTSVTCILTVGAVVPKGANVCSWGTKNYSLMYKTQIYIPYIDRYTVYNISQCGGRLGKRYLKKYLIFGRWWWKKSWETLFYHNTCPLYDNHYFVLYCVSLTSRKTMALKPQPPA